MLDLSPLAYLTLTLGAAASAFALSRKSVGYRLWMAILTVAGGSISASLIVTSIVTWAASEWVGGGWWMSVRWPAVPLVALAACIGAWLGRRLHRPQRTSANHP
jgi:hypothetical protein